MPYSWTRYTNRVESGRDAQTTLVYADGQFVNLVAAGGGDGVNISTDGLTWTGANLASSSFWGLLEYGLDLDVTAVPTWVVISIAGLVAKSVDGGVTWTNEPTVLAVTPGHPPVNCVFGNNVYALLFSTSETQWSNDISTGWNYGDVLPAGNWKALAFGNGMFIAAVQSGSPQCQISTDGDTWTAGTAPPQVITDLRFGNGMFMGVGGTSITTTTDGITWTAPVSIDGGAGIGFVSLDYGNGVWVSITNNTLNSAISEDDGVSWQNVPFPADGVGEFGVNVRFGADRFVSCLDNTFSPTTDYLVLEVASPPDPDPDPDPDDGGGGGGGGIGGGPVNQTWLYDGSTGFWSRLKSFGIDRHRVQFSFQLAGMTIGADYANGKLYRITDTALSDNGQSIEGEIVGETLATPDGATLTVNKVRVFMETGVGTSVGPGSNPQVSLSVARDSGAKLYGPEMWKTLGAIGEYHTRLEWRRLGTTRYFTVKLRITDPVKRVITGAAINPTD